MPSSFDVAAVGNAIVDVLAPASDEFLRGENLTKGAMMLIDAERASSLYTCMAAGIEASGGSAGNTVAGVASLGGRAAYVGKVAADALGEVFRHDITAIGVHFQPKPTHGGEGTGRCLVNVTPDGQRTMCTYLGAANALTSEDVDPQLIEAAEIIYLEGYLFDPPAAREAFAKAADIGRKAGRRVALTLSDAFVVERHREALLDFIQARGRHRLRQRGGGRRAVPDRGFRRGAEGAVLQGRHRRGDPRRPGLGHRHPRSHRHH